jgi:hypothetical protein
VIGDILMDGAHQMRGLGIVELESELAFGVRLGASGLFHPLSEFDEDDFVAGGGFASAGVS